MTVSILLSLYKSTPYLERYFINLLKVEDIDYYELSIVHNDPTTEELEIIDRYKNKLNIIYKSVKRESLYKSWNRAIKQSKGSFITMLNVDDIRHVNSIKNMSNFLKENKDINFCYGDFTVIDDINKTKGKMAKHKNFTKFYGIKESIGGPFFMFRRSIINEIGLFDEQFKSGGDYEFVARMALNYNGAKVKGNHGFFLNEKKGLSTNFSNNFDSIQELERTVIQLRYGLLAEIDLKYFRRALNYDLNHIYNFDKKINYDFISTSFSPIFSINRLLIKNLKYHIIFLLRKFKYLFK